MNQENHTATPDVKMLPVASTRAVEVSKNTLAITRKFYEGVMELQKSWGSKLSVVMQPSDSVGSDLDYSSYDSNSLPFELNVLRFDSKKMTQIIEGSDVVLIMLYHEQFSVARLCIAMHKPYVAITEYTLKTRLQILASSGRPVVERWCRYLLEGLREIEVRRLLKSAAAVHCNGFPTALAYARLNRNQLVFLDTRVRSHSFANQSSLAEKLTNRRSRAIPMRLLFSGRLVPMKGVMDLVEVAKRLEKNDFSFVLTVCGDGPLLEKMREAALTMQDPSRIEFRGVLDFENELLPFVRNEIDLFVCCHTQGDPSCTYLETMSCGVPICGYDNEALEGLVKHSGTGWVVPIGDSKALAEIISAISPDELEVHSRRALEYASVRSFERESSRRVQSCRDIAVSRHHRPSA